MALKLNQLHVMDCVEGMAQLKAGSVDLAFADPPFNIGYDYDTYDDDNVLDPTAREMTWKVTPSIMADKFFLSGSVEFHPQGDKTRVVFHSQLEVKIPLVGGKAEKIGLEKTEEEVGRQAQFIRNWVAKR